MKDSNSHTIRGVYLLPNLFTTAGLFAAFYSIIAALGGRFEAAAIAIFIAMITDALDGRVARYTHTQTPFGAEYDSMSDMVSFGVAPALVAYSWALQNLGKLGWLAAFFYTAAAALRLARFNTQLETCSNKYFQGLPSPSAAAVVASMIWIGNAAPISNHIMSFFIAAVTVSMGALMVSNIKYYSFKEFDFKGRVPFVAILAIVLVFVGISLNPPIVLFSTFTLYALSGPVHTLYRMQKVKRRRGTRKKS